MEETMKQVLGVGLGMVAGVVIGAAAISGLHAQGKPTIYLVTEIDVKDADGYGKEFAPKAQATIKAAGGRLVAIGGAAGAGAKPITSLDGTPPKRVTIQAWDSLDQLNGWYKGADYQAALKIGEKYATFRRYAIESQ
jgi:uncharacterized protein (DUF1330 family)